MKNEEKKDNLKEEIEAVNNDPRELTEEELEQVTGGAETSVKLITQVALNEKMRFAVREGGHVIVS